MTYQQAIRYFKQENPDLHKGSGVDYWTAQMRWALWVDTMCKDGQITQKQYDNWPCPFKYGKRL